MPPLYTLLIDCYFITQYSHGLLTDTVSKKRNNNAFSDNGYKQCSGQVG